MGIATDPRRDRVKSAYRAMATAARFRPKAPSDGFGNIEWGYDLEDPKLLTLEALEAAKEFEREDNACEHHIHGCVTANHAGALYLVLRAADLFASVDRRSTRRERLYGLLCGSWMGWQRGTEHPRRSASRGGRLVGDAVHC
jgi:hypothetical protein